MLLPAAVQWLETLTRTEQTTGVGRLKGELAGLVDEFVDAIFALEAANTGYPGGEALDEAQYAQTSVLPAMDAVREVADKLERIVPDHLWPLPKYSEILFIR
jgi:glutamine synthetase